MEIDNLVSQSFTDIQINSGDYSSGSVYQWYNFHIGDFNTKVARDFVVVSGNFYTSCFSGTGIGVNSQTGWDSFGMAESGIYLKMFEAYYWGRNIQNVNQNIMQTNYVYSAQDATSKATVFNKVDMIRALTAQKKEALEELDVLVDLYKRNRSLPRQVAGSDGWGAGLGPVPLYTSRPYYQG